MSCRCVLCDQDFESKNALKQHERDSPAHASNCKACDRHFSSKQALEQHLRDSPVHTSSFGCEKCNKSFSSEDALEQHQRDSPAHAPSFECESCDRSFGSEEALEQHIRDSPAHTSSFDCEKCNRSFGSKEAREHHLRDSPAHAPSFDCESCDRSFGSQEALEQHVRDSPIHQRRPETPLDTFLRNFPTFDYDSSLSPAISYKKLQEHQRWRREDAAAKDAWHKYQDALEDELRMWYGAENDLAAWHALCRAIGVKPLPQQCEQCEEVVRRTRVNIIDLIEWGRERGKTEKKVQTFRDVGELRAYTKRTNKVFKNTLNQEREDGNVVLRHLLRKIFRGRSSDT